jgi:DnaJ-class molecular chaperone
MEKITAVNCQACGGAGSVKMGRYAIEYPCRECYGTGQRVVRAPLWCTKAEENR